MKTLTYTLATLFALGTVAINAQTGPVDHQEQAERIEAEVLTPGSNESTYPKEVADKLGEPSSDKKDCGCHKKKKAKKAHRKGKKGKKRAQKQVEATPAAEAAKPAA